MADGRAEYRTLLEVRVRHLSGPEPEWEGVAGALERRLNGTSLRIGQAQLVVTEARRDTADDDPLLDHERREGLPGE